MKYIALFIMLFTSAFAINSRYDYLDTSSVKAVAESNVKVIGPKDNLSTAYAWLASSARDSTMGSKTNTNRRVLFLQPGYYDISAVVNIRLVQYVDIVGSGRFTSVIYSSTGTAGNGTLDSITNISSAETGVSNYISNVGIRGVSAISFDTTTNLVVTYISDCYIYGTTDGLYGGGGGTYNHDVYVYGCTIESSFDGIAAHGTSSVFKVFGTSIRCTAANVSGTSNAQMFARAVSAINGEAYLYGCELYAMSDASAIENSDSTAHAVSVTSTNGKVFAFNCSFTSSATKHAGGTTQDGDCIDVSVGTAYINGGQVLSTSGYDLQQNSGTLNVSISTVFNTGNTNGTIVYLGVAPS